MNKMIDKFKLNVIYDINGKKPQDRTIDELLETGFVIIDKDSGPTSHQIADHTKNLFQAKKAGHSGTLDPKVTGVLIIGLNKATRLMEYMLKSDKEYVCSLYLHQTVEEKKIKDVIKSFVGTIEQMPPIISAVKRQLRKRKIYSIKTLEITNENKNVLFRVRCERGTYIRKLCSDIAEKLGVGGQMVELRRTKAGPFTENDNSIGLDKLRNIWELYLESTNEKEKAIFEKELRKYVRPMEDLLKDFKRIVIQDNAVDTVSQGSDLAVPGLVQYENGIEKGEEIAMFTTKGELIAMGEAQLSSKEMEKASKGICVKTNKVFMEKETYPKFEKKNN